MTDKDINIKTTCNQKEVLAVLPKPTAKLMSYMSGVGVDHVKKVLTGKRGDKSEKAKMVKYCHDTYMGGLEVLVCSIIKSVEKQKSNISINKTKPSQK